MPLAESEPNIFQFCYSVLQAVNKRLFFKSALFGLPVLVALGVELIHKVTAFVPDAAMVDFQIHDALVHHRDGIRLGIDR